VPVTTPPLAVGDWVLVDEGAVDDLLDRRSLLQRRDPSTGYEQVIAANIDVVGIVCGLDRPVRSGRIERFVALAWDAGATPLVVLTKRDLVDDCSDAEAVAKASSGGATVAGASSITGEGVEDLRQRLSGLTVAFVGESGAGKWRALPGDRHAGASRSRDLDRHRDR
jgi:ribosome biogenesis GTPase